MMGLQATATKRKYEIGACGETGEAQANCSPTKASRWSTMQITSSTSTTTTSQMTSETTTTSSTCSSVTTNKIAVTISNATPNGMVNSVATATAQIPSAEESIAKLEVVAAVEPWGGEPIVDSISRLQAVAVPDTWGSDSTRSALATTLLSTDDLEEDDDDFEDDFDEEDSIIPSYSPLRYPCVPPAPHVPRSGYMSPSANGYAKPNYYSEPYPQQNCSRTPFNQYVQRTPHILPSANHHHHHYGWGPHHNYYSTPEVNGGNSQQTIRCAENGKSYLELGSGSYGSLDARHPKRCCDGRGGTWCNNSKQCYRERRLKMRNLSMFKLSRFRQVSEQSLYRSVLICNTLKFIDREIEAENKESATNSEFHQHPHHFTHVRLSNGNGPPAEMHQANHHQHQQQQQHHTQHMQQNTIRSAQQQPTQTQYSSDSSNNNNYGQPYNSRTPTPITSTIMSFNESMPPYDHHPLRDSQSGRATPFPGAGPDTDSGYGDEDGTRPINWGSVLSLSSQSALDPLNNNDLFSTSVTSCSLAASSTPSSITTSTSNFSSGVTPSAPSPTSVSPTSSNWEYNLLDMDLGPELTELLPSWKLTPLSADDILKSVTTPMEPTKMVLENEMDTLTHIMVGGS